MKKKIEELFRLAMKAQEKTSAYVSFETSNHGYVLDDYEFSRNHTKAETIRRWRRDLKKKARSRRRKEIYKAMQNCREE